MTQITPGCYDSGPHFGKIMDKSQSPWREIQKNNFKDLKLLCDFLQLSSDKRTALLNIKPFSLNLPRRLAEKIEKNSLNDPILLQFVPLKEETALSSDFIKSPVCDELFQKTPRLLKKYEGRALLIPSSACAMHCRFCFRKNYPYESPSNNLSQELQILQNDPSIFEIILSGGDPLSLSDQNLSSLILSLDKIPHLKILRFHTRFPIGIPERMTQKFLNVLEKIRLQTVFIAHINHVKELDIDVINALKKVQKLGIPILTHTVLLKNINDNFKALYDLFSSLAQLGFIPYYLNQLDKVTGSSHFNVSIEQGQKLMRKLQENLPGYAIPKYIQEIPHKKHKTSIPY